MTLCLVVAGRHVRALEPISILLGEAPGLTAGLRLYQRALSGRAGRDRRRRPGLPAAQQLRALLRPDPAARAGPRRGRLPGRPDRQRAAGPHPAHHRGRRGIPQVLSSGRKAPVASADRPRCWRPTWARTCAHMRDQGLGRWHGAPPLRAAQGVLCAGLGTTRDDVLTQLLVQALRDEGIQAASLSLARTLDAAPQGGKSDPFSTVFLAYPLQESQDAWQAAARDVRRRLPEGHAADRQAAPGGRRRGRGRRAGARGPGRPGRSRKPWRSSSQAGRAPPPDAGPGTPVGASPASVPEARRPLALVLHASRSARR